MRFMHFTAKLMNIGDAHRNESLALNLTSYAEHVLAEYVCNCTEDFPR